MLALADVTIIKS